MSARHAMYAFYLRLQRVLVPGLRNSQWVYRDVLKTCAYTGVSWLDLGCGHQLFPEWMPDGKQAEAAILEQPGRVVGIDADHASVAQHTGLKDKVTGDIERLPFRDDSFDLVSANMVVEHVRKPHLLLKEIHRVLKSGGIFVFHTPNFWSYGTLPIAALPDFIKVRLAAWLQGR